MENISVNSSSLEDTSNSTDSLSNSGENFREIDLREQVLIDGILQEDKFYCRKTDGLD